MTRPPADRAFPQATEPVLTATHAIEPGTRVSTLELFFDLVFVYTITQVTHLVAHAHGAGDLARAFLLLAVVWWMFGGYAWLTNNLGTRDTLVRVLLIAAMAGFLVMSLSIAEVAGRDGVAFGVAYLFVTVTHAVMFTCAPNASARAIYRVAPFNVLGAGLVIATGFVGGVWNLVLWAAALAALMVTALLRAERRFEIRPAHFAERHGLIVIIALGESVVGIAVGAGEVPVGPALAAVVSLGLALVASLWWSYFAHDDARAEEVMTNATGGERARLALQVYWFAHLLMIAGIVVAAAGLEGVVAALGHAAEPGTAEMLGAGVALYLVGEAAFRRWLCLGPISLRLAAATLCAAGIVVGRQAGGVAQLAVMVAILVAMLVAEPRLAARWAPPADAPGRQPAKTRPRRPAKTRSRR